FHCTRAAMSLTVMTSSTIPALWRLRLVTHGVRLSSLAYLDDEPGIDAQHVAWRVEMDGAGLTGAEAAPLRARVNIRAASFVLRAFCIDAAEILVDADGGLVGFSAHPVSETPEMHAVPKMQDDRLHESGRERVRTGRAPR